MDSNLFQRSLCSDRAQHIMIQAPLPATAFRTKLSRKCAAVGLIVGIGVLLSSSSSQQMSAGAGFERSPLAVKGRRNGLHEQSSRAADDVEAPRRVLPPTTQIVYLLLCVLFHDVFT